MSRPFFWKEPSHLLGVLWAPTFSAMFLYYYDPTYFLVFKNMSKSLVHCSQYCEGFIILFKCYLNGIPWRRARECRHSNCHRTAEPCAWRGQAQWWSTLASSFPVTWSSSHTCHEQKAHQLQNKDVGKRNQYSLFMAMESLHFYFPIDIIIKIIGMLGFMYKDIHLICERPGMSFLRLYIIDLP